VRGERGGERERGGREGLGREKVGGSEEEGSSEVEGREVAGSVLVCWKVQVGGSEVERVSWEERGGRRGVVRESGCEGLCVKK